ncbi:MAG: two-component system, OmpR family, sensor kinase [Actinomycetota bacterium]|nr:two-component system, OmpR family, sensor kinase [Actinomycetota bacterium]
MAAGTERRRRAVSQPTRLTVIAALLVAATVLVVAGVAARLMRDDLGASLDRRLGSAATSFREGPASRVADPAQLTAEARRWLAVQAHAEDEVIAVRTAGGDVLSTSGGLDLGAVGRGDELLAATTAKWWTVPGPNGTGHLRALTVPLVRRGQPSGTLLVAATTTGVERTVDHLLSAVAWASGLGLAFAVALAFVSVRKTLQPLSRMAAEIDAIEPRGALPDCLAATVDAPADEVGRVADAFDSLLVRIDEAIASQRRFISDASHELRTPLTVARGQLELVGRLDDPEADRSVRLALEELDRIGSTVEELLLLARLDEGLPLAREAVEADLTLREAALRGMLLGQGDIVVDAPEGLSVIADPDRLLQVVSNLTGNALRHGGPGVTVTLSARPEPARPQPARPDPARPDPARAVTIDVADTGPGIPAADLSHVFDRFYRGSAARRGVPGGAGLGLAIVASLVEAMGGTISVSSRVGEGTTFSIRLPAADAAPPAPGGAGGGPGEVGEQPSGAGADLRVSGTRGG